MSIFEVGLSSLIIAGSILSHTEVVVGAIILGVEFGSCVVDLHLLEVVVGESGEIEELLFGELGGIAVVDVEEFAVALAQGVDGSHNARVA